QQISNGGLDVLAESTNMPHLAELSIRGCPITTAGVQALANSPHRGALRRLSLACDLSRNEMPESAAALGGPGVRFRLQALALYGHRLGPAGAAALAAPHMGELRELDLERNNLDDEGVTALARSPYLRGLSRLNLGSNRLTARA